MMFRFDEKKRLIENCIDEEYIFGDWEKKNLSPILV